jgi:hypothetical protein
MLRVDRIGFNRNFFGSQAGSPEVHRLTATPERNDQAEGVSFRWACVTRFGVLQ